MFVVIYIIQFLTLQSTSPLCKLDAALGRLCRWPPASKNKVIKAKLARSIWWSLVKMQTGWLSQDGCLADVCLSRQYRVMDLSFSQEQAAIKNHRSTNKVDWRAKKGWPTAIKTFGRAGFGTAPMSAVWCQRRTGNPVNVICQLSNSSFSDDLAKCAQWIFFKIKFILHLNVRSQYCQRDSFIGSLEWALIVTWHLNPLPIRSQLHKTKRCFWTEENQDEVELFRAHTTLIFKLKNIKINFWPGWPT